MIYDVMHNLSKRGMRPVHVSELRREVERLGLDNEASMEAVYEWMELGAVRLNKKKNELVLLMVL